MGKETDEVQVKETSTDFYIRWTGKSGPENAAAVSTVYSTGKLFVGGVVTGTPILGMACTITATPMNYKLKNGESRMTLGVWNLDKSFAIDVTPASGYSGQTLKLSVSINASSDSVLYARGSFGA